jgi:hypothetical protein
MRERKRGQGKKNRDLIAGKRGWGRMGEKEERQR